MSKGLNIPDSRLTRRLTQSFEDDFNNGPSGPRVHPIEPTDWRTWDALATNLPAAAANDDLGCVTGTPGTDFATIQAGDIGGASSARKAGVIITLPQDYAAGCPIAFRFNAGMITTVCDTSCTVDLSVYKATSAGAVGSDLVTTAAQSINSLTYANKDFVVTPTGLAPGDRLYVLVTITYADSGDAGVMVPEISDASMRYSMGTDDYLTGGTVSIGDSADGLLSLVTAATTNDECFIATRQKPLLFSTTTPFTMRAGVTFSDADADNGVVAVGFADQLGAGLIQTDGTSLISGGVYGAMFIKKKGNAYWSCVSSTGSNGTTVTTTDLNTTDANNKSQVEYDPGSTLQVLEIEVLPNPAGVDIAFSVDGTVVAKHTALTITNAGQMRNVAYVQAGSAAAQTLVLDHWDYHQKR